MKVSLKVEYGLRVLVQLARSYDQSKLANLESLSECEDVPSNYLVQILNELRQGGLVKSQRGKQGGYSLLIPPKQLTLHQAISVLDYEMINHTFSSAGQSGQVVYDAWKKISDQLNDELKKISIHSLAQSSGVDMYYI